jgi:serine/threonine-protein kinase
MTASAQALQAFRQALALDTTERAAFLATIDDAALRTQVDDLLAADRAAGDFLDEPARTIADRRGERLGAYRLLNLVGHGGMGSVYRAERSDGVVTRPLAIKLLLFDDGDLRERFAREQRILGSLDHANIARLIDVGETPGGAPYLVMEFVDGVPITDYVRQHAFTPRDAAQLFLKVLDAVQDAHGHLVVHRDIKPGNVLVDAHGEPKLLDFGIAKLLDVQAPHLTRTGLNPLTPDYASPEQVRGEAIGIASDIYSLGVLLYELVAGNPPYRVTSRTPSEVERIVCDTDPPRPSTLQPHADAGGNRRDLDAIVLKAMEKSPRHRYASCAEFATDLRAWCAGEAVQARVAPWPERFQRSLRRHKLAFAVAATALLTLLIGSGMALWQAHVADQERDRAQRVNRFLTDMLAAANPADLGRKASIGDVLDRSRRLAERELADDPRVFASTEQTLAQTYHALGNLDLAEQSAQQALAAARRGGDAAGIFDAQLELGEIITQRGDYDRAEPILLAAQQLAQANADARQRAAVAIALGSLQSQRGHSKLAQHWFEQALADLPPADSDMRAEAMNNLGIVENALGHRNRALALQQQVVDMLRKVHPHGHPGLAKALANLGSAYEIAGRLDEAEAAYAQALPMQIDLLGESHPDLVETLSSMTFLDRRRKDSAAALRDGAQAWKAAQGLDARHPMYAYAAAMYAAALSDNHRPADAVPLLKTALTARAAELPKDHPLVANTQSALGLAMAQTGDVAGGLQLARDAYQRLRDKLGEQHEFTQRAAKRMAQIQAMTKPN